jgi:hypothetical protein
MLLAKDHEDSGNVSDKAAINSKNKAYFNYRENKNSVMYNKPNAIDGLFKIWTGSPKNTMENI